MVLSCMNAMTKQMEKTKTKEKKRRKQLGLDNRI